MLALLLTLAATWPLDDLVKHQHGQMLRYWQRQRPTLRQPHKAVTPPWDTLELLRTPSLSVDRREANGSYALIARPPAGPATCIPLVAEALADHPLSQTLRGKTRVHIIDRLAISVGTSAEEINAGHRQLCQGLPIANPSAVRDPALLALLPRQLDDAFWETLGGLQARIGASQTTRRRRWNLPQQQPAVASRALQTDLRLQMGASSEPRLPLHPQLRPIGETSSFTAHEVLLPTLNDFDAYGHLLLPRNANGKQPAVIVQHGLGGQPKDLTCAGPAPDKAYHCLGAHLAEQGYVVFAPYVTHPAPPGELINPLAAMARSLGRMRISAELIKLHQIVDFLQSRPEIDPRRIGYYGLSYGGYSALWMAPLEPRLAAVVVSGHFNDWTEKITNLENPTSYMFHPDEDFYNHDVLHRFTHVELIAAMWPRPVCVEFAERDPTTTPAWHQRAWSEVAAIAKTWKANFVRDHFDGIHEIHGIGTVDFLNRHLRPERPAGRDAADLVAQRLQAPILGAFHGEGAFRGIALRAQRRGDAAPLIVRYGTQPGAADLGTATLTSVTDGWVDAPVSTQMLRKGFDYFFEIRTEPTGAGSYDLYGPRPLGGQRFERDFAVSFRLLR